MDTNELVRYIRSKGCPVRLYNDRHLFRDKSMGHFTEDVGKPSIHVTTKGHSREMVNATLVHEFAHYLQYQDGFLGRINSTYGGWSKFTSWLEEGKEYSSEEVALCRSGVLTIEFDAELRTLDLAVELGVDIGPRGDYIRAINAYMTDIKFAFEKREWMDVPDNDMFSDRLPRRSTVLKPLTPNEQAMLDILCGLRKRRRYQ
jgi:hypothetical protein